MQVYLWILAYLTVFLTHTESLSEIYSNNQRSFNFPDEPQSASDIPPGFETQPGSYDLERKLTITLPALPTGYPLPTSVQTCICVPTGTCTGNTVIGGSDGSGLIDIRMGSETRVTPTRLPITCATGLTRCCQPGPYQCGARYPPLAGAPTAAPGDAPYGSYPWQAVLLAPDGVYLGSGVLLNSLYVLTVAHKSAQFINAPTALTVRMGEWNSRSDAEPITAQEYTVSRIVIHPSFNAANLKNDVAILRLSTSVPLGNTPTVGTGCLPTTTFIGSRCFVSGWGRNDFVNGTFQTIQKQVDVPILQNTVCQTTLAETKLGPSFVFDTQSFLCAGGEPGKDACTGDGGSPLMCSVNNRWFVAGLVAWGIGCGTNHVPGVYVNVSTYVPWIQTNINT